MSRRRPFKIQIFVAEGMPEGLRLVQKSNWIGQGIVCPRGRYTEVKSRGEFSRSGVYLLVGRDGDQLPTVYIGEAEQVRSRLNQHYSEKDFWQEAIVFTTTGTPLNKAQVKYLEARLVELARKQNRSKLENTVLPKRPGLAEPDQAEMEGYLDELLSLLPVLGVAFFEEAEAQVESRKIYRLQLKGCDATGFETNTGFTVRKGSLARAKTVGSMKQHVPGYYRLRQELISEGALEKTSEGYRFTTDHPFASPSGAASVCSGRSANGLTEWTDESGTTLKANREKAAGA